MKKIEANRYPHSATLFKFCKEALEIRYDGNVKVIDQDVGAILNYDPADCSHWKKGKKNIRALSTLRSIADHLNIDERLLIDIASGRIDLEEAVFEYRGYGAFSLSGRNLESLKKEYFKNPVRWQTDGNMRSFEELFDIDRAAISKVADVILEKGKFSEAPIYIPEVFQQFDAMILTSDESIQDTVEVIREQGRVEVKFKGPEMRPYMRFLAAKEVFKYMAQSKDPIASRFHHAPAEILDIQANIFAGMLLVPAKIMRTEVEKIDCSLDIVMQLADVFWVSKALMNQRLRDYMENLN